jgi:hypothetical protein
MSPEDINEAIELYYDWLLTNEYDGQKLSFKVFEDWFTLLATRIAKSKSQLSDFDVERVEETVFGHIFEDKMTENGSNKETERNCILQ